MGRKRKAVECIAVAKQDKTSDACSETSAKEELHLHTDNSNAVGATNVGSNVQPNSNGIPLEKNLGVTKVVVRRSERIKSSNSPAGRLGVESAVEHVNLVENEEEEAPSSQVNNLPVLRERNLEGEPLDEPDSTPPEVNQRTLEEKVDYLVGAVDEFKSKVFGRSNEDSSPDLSYRSLYIKTQKKIEALMEENYDLVRKLEFARGKIAAYELMKNPAKEVILVSTVGKVTEATATLSPQAVQNCSPPPSDAVDDSKPKNNYRKKKAKR